MAKMSGKPSEPNTETDQPTSSSKQGKMKKVPSQHKSESGGKVRWPYSNYTFFHWFPLPQESYLCPAWLTPTAPQPWLLLMNSPILSISHFLPPKPLSFWPHSVVLLSLQALKTATKVKKTLQRTLSKKVSEKTTNSIRKAKKTRQSTLFGHYHRLNETLRQNDPEQNQEEVQKPISGRKDLGSQVTSEWDREPQKYPWSLRNCQVCTHWILQQQGTLMVIQ